MHIVDEKIYRQQFSIYSSKRKNRHLVADGGFVIKGLLSVLTDD
jgi:hypothetical protein